MDFDLTVEQEMIRKEVRRFAKKEIAPIAAELDEKEEFSPELTKKMGDIGLFGMFVPEMYEGQGLDYLSYIIGVEEIARVDGSQAATIAAGSNVSFTWALYDGEVGHGSIVSHTYPAVGTYTARVTASNSVSTATATTTVTIFRLWRVFLPLFCSLPAFPGSR